MGGAEGKVAYIGMIHFSLNSETVCTNGSISSDTEGTFRPERQETTVPGHLISD